MTGGNIITLAVSMAANLSGNIIRKAVTERDDSGGRLLYSFNTVSSIVAAGILLIFSGSRAASVFTVITGVFFGIITALGQLLYLRALEIGPLSYTTVIISLSAMIPTLCGALFWNESITLSQWTGIALMAGCFLMSGGEDKARKKKNPGWLLFCASAFLCSGTIGVMQKWHQSSAHKAELDAFLIIAFICSAAFSGIRGLMLFPRAGHEKAIKHPANALTPAVWALIITAGVCIAINNKFNLYLSGVMDSAVFFPIVNGGGLILTTAAGVIFFRERLSVKQWLGLFLGIASVIFLCGAFKW